MINSIASDPLPLMHSHSVSYRPCFLSHLLSLSLQTSSYMAYVTDTIHSSTPIHLNAHQTTSVGTLSKALSQSTKAIQSSLFLARYFSCSWRTMKIASVVLFPAIIPNCMLSIFTTFLNAPLNDSLKNHHGMFYQFYSSVRATFQCQLRLLLVNIHQATRYVQSSGMYTIPNHCIA